MTALRSYLYLAVLALCGFIVWRILIVVPFANIPETAFNIFCLFGCAAALGMVIK